MPVGWKTEKWPLPEDIEYEVAFHRRNDLLHTLGNLTLVTGPLNSAMSNAEWDRKRRELEKHSVLLLNRELTCQPTWNECMIRSRSRRMADLIAEAWLGQILKSGENSSNNRCASELL